MTRLLLALALFVPVTLFAADGVAPAGGEAKAEKPVRGEIAKIEAGSITIKVKKEEVTLKIAADAKFVGEDKKECKVEDLKAGLMVAVTKNAAGEAAKVQVMPAKKEGDHGGKKDGDKPKKEGDKPKKEGEAAH